MGFINQIITRGHHLVSIIYIHENYPSYRWTVGYWCWSDGLLVKIDVSTEPPLDLAARPIGAECGWLFGSLLYRLGPCRRCAEDASDAWTARVGFANQIREFMKIGNNWPVLFCDPVYLSYFQALVSKHGRKSCENHGRKWTNHLWMDLGRLGHYFMYIHWSHWMVDFPASHGLHLLRKSHFFQCQVEAAGCTFPCLTSCIDNISLRHEFFHGMGQNHSNPINHSYIFIIVPIWLGESTFMFTFIFTIPDCFPWFFHFARDVPYVPSEDFFALFQFQFRNHQGGAPRTLGPRGFFASFNSSFRRDEIWLKKRTEVASAFSWWRQKLEIERKLMEVDGNIGHHLIVAIIDHIPNGS